MVSSFCQSMNPVKAVDGQRLCDPGKPPPSEGCVAVTRADTHTVRSQSLQEKTPTFYIEVDWTRPLADPEHAEGMTFPI